MSDELLSIVVDSPLPADPPAASEEAAPKPPRPRRIPGRKTGRPSKLTPDQRREVEAWRLHCFKPIVAAARRGQEGWDLCEWRILHFGHWSRYLKLISRVRAVHPDRPLIKIRRAVMVEHFGYRNVVEERARFYFWWELAGPWLPTNRPTPNEIVERAQALGVGYMNREEQEANQALVDAAFAKLPAVATAAVQMQWIITHPRMFRLGQRRAVERPGDDVDEPLTLADLAGAPSRMAVVLLQDALKDRKGFLKSVSGVQSKALGDNESSPSSKTDEPEPDPLAAFATATPEEIASWKAHQTK